MPSVPISRPKVSRELSVQLPRGTLRTSHHWYVRLGVRLEGWLVRPVLQLVLRRGEWPVRRGEAGAVDSGADWDVPVSAAP